MKYSTLHHTLTILSEIFFKEPYACHSTYLVDQAQCDQIGQLLKVLADEFLHLAKYRVPYWDILKKHYFGM